MSSGSEKSKTALASKAPAEPVNSVGAESIKTITAKAMDVLIAEFKGSQTFDPNDAKAKIEATVTEIVTGKPAEPPEQPKYSLAADVIVAAYNHYVRSKQATDPEKSKLLYHKAIKLMASAMKTPGITDLMFAFNQVNTAAVLPEELDDDEGIDPDNGELDLSLFDDDSDEDDDEEDTDADDTGSSSDDDDDSDDDDTDEDDDEDYTEESSLSITGDKAKLAMANALSFSGRAEDRRLASELLKSPKSAK